MNCWKLTGKTIGGRGAMNHAGSGGKWRISGGVTSSLSSPHLRYSSVSWLMTSRHRWFIEQWLPLDSRNILRHCQFRCGNWRIEIWKWPPLICINGEREREDAHSENNRFIMQINYVTNSCGGQIQQRRRLPTNLAAANYFHLEGFFRGCFRAMLDLSPVLMSRRHDNRAGAGCAVRSPWQRRRRRGGRLPWQPWPLIPLEFTITNKQSIIKEWNNS